MSRRLPSLKQINRQLEREYLKLLSKLPEAQSPETQARIREFRANTTLSDDAYIKQSLREIRKRV